MDAVVLKEIENIVGSDYISTSTVNKKLYGYGLGPSGDFVKGRPDIIVLPKNPQEVSKIVKLANQYKIPITPRGAGTSYQATQIAPYGGIMLDMSCLDKILQIDEDNMVVVAEGGCSVYKIMSRLDERGLMFPFSPIYTTGPQIGAAVACNATGIYMTRLHSTADNIVGLEVVLPTGEIVTLGSGAYKGGYGFYQRYTGDMDLIGLFANAGGRTGIITRVAIRIKPKPKFQDLVVYGWKREDAERVARHMYKLQRDYVFDLQLLNNWNYISLIKTGQFPPEIHFVSIISGDGKDEDVLDKELKWIKSVCDEEKGVELPKALGQAFVLGPKYLEFIGHKGFTSMSNISGHFIYCPIMKFPEVYDVYEDTCKKYDIWNETFLPLWLSFAGRNVMNPYPLIGHSNPYNKEEIENLYQGHKEFIRRVTELGCTQYLLGDAHPSEAYERLGSLYDLMKRVKKMLDPNNIMNPSKIYGGF